jgi:outer membrane receptor for ferrienterochelin and colicins
MQPESLDVEVRAQARTEVTVELHAPVELEEEVIVTATRTGKRLQDEAVRVEVLAREEIEEKLLMTPGDVAMLHNETSGLRVQVASPSLGAANVRIQGLRGRYTQILADGLPLYGGQTGSIGLLQIPPMDLGQIEIIKGVASAFYGASALGGAVNLVSRRAPDEGSERELVANRTTRGGTDAVLWWAAKPKAEWGFTFLGGGHHQERHDVDGDGWADIAGYSRLVVRPRFLWDNGQGRSVLVTGGAMLEDREGGTLPGATVPDGQPYVEALDTQRFDGGIIARFPVGAARLFSVRASAMSQSHRHVFGDVLERDRHDTALAEATLSGTSGRHTWVVGAALQADRYHARDVTGFDYTHSVPGVYLQDDLAVTAKTTLSASVRLDHHNVYGTFLNPRASALLRPGPWTIRASLGTGYFAPTPFTEETEAVGLSRVLPLSGVEAERAYSASIDAGRTVGAIRGAPDGLRFADP